MPWQLTRISRSLGATMLIINPNWHLESKNNTLSIIWVGNPVLLWPMTILLTRKKFLKINFWSIWAINVSFFTRSGLGTRLRSRGTLDYPRSSEHTCKLSSYFSSAAELLSEYNSISTKTWDRSRGIRWYFVEQQTPAPIHLQIPSWYRCQLTAYLVKHVNSIGGRCCQFRHPRLYQGSKSRKISYRAIVHDFVRGQKFYRARFVHESCTKKIVR